MPYTSRIDCKRGRSQHACSEKEVPRSAVESIEWGDNWVRALERAIDECEDIVLVLSPDFCNSEWAETERTSALKRKARPLTLRPCDHLPNFPRFLRQVQAIDVSSDALFEQNY